MHIFNAGGSARWGPVPFMKKIPRSSENSRGQTKQGERITKGRSQRIKNRKLLRRRSFIPKRIVRGLSGLRYLPRQVCRGSTHRELEVSTTQSASKKSCQPSRQAAFRFFLQSLHVNDGGKAFCVKGSGKHLEVVRGASRDGALK